MNSLRSAFKVLLAALLVAAPTALAAGEISGSIHGYVFDSEGKLLGDHQLTLKGSKLMRPEVATSRADGTFHFENLPPGEDYELTATGPGQAAPVVQTGIVVQLGQTTSLDVLFGELGETIVVKGERANPVMAPDSAQVGVVLTSEKAVMTPIFNQVQGMTQLAPGVGPGTRPSTRGGLSRWTKFYVDGMDTSDVSDGNMTSNVNFNAVENFEVITGGMDAEYNSMGAVQNVVTRTGGNEWVGDVQLVASPDFLSLRSRAASDNPALVGPLTEPLSTREATTSFYAPHVNIGGPILKDRLWFFASAQANFSNRENFLTFRGGASEVRPTVTRTLIGRVKVTWQPTDDDRLSLAFNYDNNTIQNSIGRAFVAPEAESNIDRGGYFLTLNYSRRLSDDLSFQLQTGATLKNSLFSPQFRSDNPAHLDLNNGGFTTVQAGALRETAGNYLFERKQRLQFDPSLTWRTGGHRIKGGLQISYLSGRSITQTLGGVRYLNRGGVCDPADPATFGFCSERLDFFNAEGERAPNATNAANLKIGSYVQDRWTVNRHLTVGAGVRFDVGRLLGDGGRPLGTLVGYGPRLSATYDPAGDRKLLFTAHYGRSNDVGDVFISQRGNPSLYVVTSTFQRPGNTFANCVPNPTAPQPGCRIAGGPAGREFAIGSTPPSTDEVSVGVKREVADRTSIGADATWRRYSNLWVEEEVNRIWDISGTRIIGYRDGVAQSRLKVHNPASAYRDYKGLDLWVQGRPGNWDLLANYTLSLTQGTVDEYFDGYLNNPRFAQLFEGHSSDDTRHVFKGAISYKTGIGLDFGFRVQYRTGTPLWMRSPNPGDSTRDMYRSRRGTGHSYVGSAPNFNDPDTIAELRNPDTLLLDAQARYDLASALKLEQKLELTFMVVNLLNNTDALFYSDQYRPTGVNRFGTVAARHRPLQAQLLLRARF